MIFMKNVKITNETIAYFKKKLKLLAGVAILSGVLVGCEAKVENADSIGNVDIIDTNFVNDDGSFETVVQKLDVPGENFKLVVEYSCVGLDEDRKWRITSDKKLMMRVYTEGLASNQTVYLNDLHMDTSIIATKKMMDGILQDTMDDGIHGTTQLGFAIGDDKSCYIVNVIEGQNKDFIEGSFYGFTGYDYGRVSGELRQKRYLESDYLSNGVYANHVTGIYGLLVKEDSEEDYRGVDVSSDVYIRVCKDIAVTIHDTGVGEIHDEVWRYEDDGSYEVISETESVRLSK